MRMTIFDFDIWKIVNRMRVAPTFCIRPDLMHMTIFDFDIGKIAYRTRVPYAWFDILQRNYHLVFSILVDTSAALHQYFLTTLIDRINNNY